MKRRARVVTACEYSQGQGKIMNPSVVLFVWGAIVALIGVSGFVTSKSVPSLIAGIVAGALLLGAGALLKRGKDFGFWLGAGVTLLLVLRFAPVFLKTQDVWPAGAMTVLGVLALVALFVSRRA